MLSKEDIFEAVWRNRAQTTFDPNLVDRAISTIRSALGSLSDCSHYLRVERGRGVIFDAPVARATPIEIALPDPVHIHDRRARIVSWKTILIFAGIVVILGALTGLFWALYHRQARELIDATPLTASGTPKYAPLLALHNPHRVLFTEFVNGRYQISWVEPKTKSSGKVLTDIANPTALAISRDENTLLVRSIVGSFQDDGPLFLQSILGGSSIFQS